MKEKPVTCAICGKKIKIDKDMKDFAGSCDFICSKKCLKEEEKRNPVRIPKKFKYRLTLSEIGNKKKVVFSIPITEKELSKFVRHKFEVRGKK